MSLFSRTTKHKAPDVNSPDWADGYMTSEAEHCYECRAELAECREALEELVELKDGPRDAEYERRKPLAWATARRVLSRR